MWFERTESRKYIQLCKQKITERGIKSGTIEDKSKDYGETVKDNSKGVFRERIEKT